MRTLWLIFLLFLITACNKNENSIGNPGIITIDSDVLNIPEDAKDSFVFSSDKFWYGEGFIGLMSYDPITQIENIEFWERMGFNDPYCLSGYILLDAYDNTFWIFGDGANGWYIRRFSTETKTVLDSVKLSEMGDARPFTYAWDNELKRIVGLKGAINQNTLNKIFIYNTITKSLTEKIVDIEYDKSLFKYAKIVNIFIKPDRKLYLTVTKENSLGSFEYILYEYNNVEELKQISSYIFPQTYTHIYSHISIYNDEFFIEGDKLILN